MNKSVDFHDVTPQFPSQLDDLLSSAGKTKLATPHVQAKGFNRYNTDCTPSNVALFKGVFSKKKKDSLINKFDEFIYPALKSKGRRKVRYKYPYSIYHKSKTSPYSAKFLIRDAAKSSDPDFYDLCESVGIIDLANSESLRNFIIRASGYELRLGTGLPYCQILCYEQGDHIGLHSDWLPRVDQGEHFLVCNICLPNDFVQEQLFLYEQDDYLQRLALPSDQAYITLLKPPFWHMATPLVGKKGNEPLARRWLITVSFQLR